MEWGANLKQNEQGKKQEEQIVGDLKKGYYIKNYSLSFVQGPPTRLHGHLKIKFVKGLL